MVNGTTAHCDERLGRCEKIMSDFSVRMAKVENRFLVILTLLCTNLLGVVGTLFVLLTK